MHKFLEFVRFAAMSQGFMKTTESYLPPEALFGADTVLEDEEFSRL